MRFAHLGIRARILLASLGAASACLWALAVAGAWLRIGEGENLARAAAVTVTVTGVIIATGLWLERRLRGDDWRTLTRLSADLYSRIPEEDRPPLMRSAR